MMKKWLFRIGLFILLMILVYGLSNMLAQPQPVAASELPQTGIQAAPMQSEHFAINWSVIGAGGGEMSSSNYQLNTTVGQPITGNSSSTTFAHHAGYWQNWFFNIFLPLIRLG